MTLRCHDFTTSLDSDLTKNQAVVTADLSLGDIRLTLVEDHRGAHVDERRGLAPPKLPTKWLTPLSTLL